MEDTTYENAVNENLREIHKMVETVKKDPEVTVRYMIRHLMYIEEINKAKAEAKSEGRAEGKEEGRAEGRVEGEVSGSLYRLTVQICRKMKMNQSLERIAEDLVEESSVIEPIYNAAREFAPEYEPALVFRRINVSE